MKCNICNNKTFKKVKNRGNVKCTNCGSLERTRLIWLYLQKLNITKNSKILHIAPEKGLYEKLSKLSDNYTVADIKPGKYKWTNCMKINLCELESFPSNYYDLIIHSHVLEHCFCSYAYSLFHLHRMLNENGLHFFVVPFMKGEYDECYQNIGKKEKKRRFGQGDHIKRFGVNDIQNHLGKIIKLPKYFNALDDFEKELLLNCNIPENQWNGFTISTVIQIKKQDIIFNK